MLKEWLTKKEAAAELNCSTRQIERFTEDGRIHKNTDGRSPMFSAGDVERIRAERAGPDPALPLEFGQVPPNAVAVARRNIATPAVSFDPSAWQQALTPEPKPLYCGLREAAKITGLPSKVIRKVFDAAYTASGAIDSRPLPARPSVLRSYYAGGRMLVNRADLEKI